MNKKQFIILAVLTFVSVIAAVLTLTMGKGRFSVGKVFFSGGGIPPFDVNAVSCINIEDSRGRLRIEKKNGMWVIPSRSNYPADIQLISGFVTAIRQVKLVRTLETDKKYWRTYGVDLSSGNRETVTVELSDSKKTVLASIVMGNMYFPPDAHKGGQPPVGRYLLSNTRGALPFLAGVSFSEAAPDPGLWLDKDFLKFPEQSLLSVKNIASGKLKWELRKLPGGHDFTLLNPTKGKAVSIDKIHKYIRKLSEISFEDVFPRKNADAPDNFASIAIESGGALYEIKIGVEKERFLMTVIKRSAHGAPESPSFFSKWAYRISPLQADALNVPFSYFSAE